MPPREVALLIEVADASLKKDTTTKAGLYARAGVRDYWVVNPHSLVTKVHRKPSATGYGDKANVRPTKALASLVIPSLTLRLAGLGIGGA